MGYFSDPSISLNGIPTGHATDGNNALTLRQLKHTVTAYKNTTYSNNHPANDNFINAIPLTGTSGSTTKTNVGATKESGEPNHANISTATNSVWWTWTAPATGFLTLDTLQTSFDTVMACYTGRAVNGLTLIANNDDFDYAKGYYQSLVSFTALSNTTYTIAVAVYDGTNGIVTLAWAVVAPSSIIPLQNGIPCRI